MITGLIPLRFRFSLGKKNNMTYILAEDVFKATIKSPDVTAQELWLSFYNQILIPANVYSSIAGDYISLPITVDEFYGLVIHFMECDDTDKVCAFFRSNLDEYISEQELEPDSVLIKVCNNYYCCEVVA
jgi:hypothetical protein